MPVVRLDSGASIDCPLGGRLIDACDEGGLGVPFGCRAGTCGTCRVAVLEGVEYVSAADEAERAALDALEAGPRDRLACRIVIANRPGTITLAVSCRETLSEIED